MENDLNIPDGNQQLMPYLILNNAQSFLEFTQNVFNGVILRKEMRDEKTIMHAEIQIGDCTIMIADSSDEYSSQTTGLFLYVKDADATYKLALANGAAKIMEPADQSYGRSCGVKDLCGNTWWITSVKK